MGMGYSCECGQCKFWGFFRVGVGMMFPRVYRETMEKARNGELGELLKAFLEQFPDGALNAEYVAKVCPECGIIDSVMDLSMYIPKEGVEKSKNDSSAWSVSAPFYGAEYVDSDDLEKYYELYQKYPHKCDKCGTDCYTVSEHEVDSMKCPLCHADLKTNIDMFWD